jgi:hypothetical protein
MRDLACGDGTLAGIAAFYSIIQIPRDEIPAVLAEQRRLLRPGGLLLLAFHEGDRVEHIDAFLEQPVSLDFVFFTRAEMEDHLDTAGFELVWSRQRRPTPTSKPKPNAPTCSRAVPSKLAAPLPRPDTARHG